MIELVDGDLEVLECETGWAVLEWQNKLPYVVKIYATKEAAQAWANNNQPNRAQ